MALHIFAAKLNSSRTPFPTGESPFLLTLILVHTLTIHDLDLSISVYTMPLCRSTHPQLWNVLLRSRVELLRHSVVFGSYRWLLVLFLVCRAFEPAEGSYLVRPFRSWDRPTMAIMASITRSLAFRCLRHTTIISNPIRL